MLNPSLAGQFAALDLTGGGTITGNVTVSGTLQTTNLGVGLAPDTTRIHMLSQASDTAPTAFTADDAVVGRSALTGASSGAIFFRYDSTNNKAFLGALSPSVAWRNLIIGAANTILQNASAVAKCVLPGTASNDINLSSAGIYGWSSTADATAAADTTITRSAAGKLATSAVYATATTTGDAGVKGTGLGAGNGVWGVGGATNNTPGVKGTVTATNAYGIEGYGAGTGGGIYGEAAATGPGGYFYSTSGYGVIAETDTTSPAKATLHLVPQDADPSSPAAGNVYYNSTTSQLKWYNGTYWVEPVQYAYASISSANITGTGAGQLGHAQGVAIVAAPGAGYAIEFLSGVVILDFAGAAYTGGGNITFNYEAGGGALSAAVTYANSVGGAADKIALVAAAVPANNQLVANKGINLVAASAPTNPGSATGVLRVKVAYRVHTTGL